MTEQHLRCIPRLRLVDGKLSKALLGCECALPASLSFWCSLADETEGLDLSLAS